MATATATLVTARTQELLHAETQQKLKQQASWFRVSGSCGCNTGDSSGRSIAATKKN